MFVGVFGYYYIKKPRPCQHEYTTKDLAYLKVYKDDGSQLVTKFYKCNKCNKVKTEKEYI